ncbi:DUF2339 domain-containing protein [Aurantiacibacter aquimixticola]|uniref:DUF2339 domain-containing protein n=1 Tax=Aurantiacibacter aquimixticola TaxID=1958945 RepID=A0A419RVQ7_9SPHN|nr:DUF2339 domain-containing protein [Aurantiacibacter aquimixticola]RJY09853.1 DUF2339 domain-containing protein [Aurantiacibacter aquimixticola]
MEFLLIIVIGAVLFGLWQRVDDLERRLADAESRGYGYAPEMPPTHVADQEPIVRTAPREPTPEFDHERGYDPIDVEPVAMPEPQPEPAMPLAAADAPSVVEEPPSVEQHDDDDASSYRAPRFDFEDIFGRKLPIWAGGIALAVGGVFLVIYSIEAGLLGPEVRVALSFLFGLVLLGGAEAAYRFEDKVADPRVRQALAGAGIATLYAAFYLAGSLYGLIGPATAFVGLALVTALALGLTARFGLPTAILGLLGGFATPLLVASEDANVPVLAFYLALLTCGLAITARRLGVAWLGAAALAGGFGWGGLMLLAQPVDSADFISIGLYLLVLGIAVPLLLTDETRLPFTRLMASALAAAQLAALVGLAGFDLLTWGLYLLLAAALAVLAWRHAELRVGNGFATALGAILLMLWPNSSADDFVTVAAALGVIGLGLPLALIWRGRADDPDLLQLSLGALLLGGALFLRFGSWDNEVHLPGLAMASAALAAIVAAGAYRIWRRGGDLDRLLAMPVAASAILSFAALHVVLADWAEVVGAAVVTLVLAELIRRRRGKSLAGVAWIGAVVTAIALLSIGTILAELSRAFGDDYGDPILWQSLIRWASATLPFLALAAVEWRRFGRRIAGAITTLMAYTVLAQFIPSAWLAWTAAALALAVTWFLPRRLGALGALLVIGLFWAVAPMIEWLGTGIEAVGARPAFVGDLPTVGDTLRRVLPFVAVLALAIWRIGMARRWRILFTALAGAGALVVLHTLFKQIFAIASPGDFTNYGLLERTVWQALLIGGGAAVLRLRPSLREPALASIAAGCAHFAYFSFILHNPLWDAQAVGPAPIANALLAAYGVAGIGVWLLASTLRERTGGKLRPMRDGLFMFLTAFWALSELRHAFAGSILIYAPMTQTEDLLRSLLGIVLALGFLWWGSRSDQRTWRIGSLVLMLVAVLKVFLFDAAELEGLLRIGSFLALGASLIGIGWVYSRQLSSRSRAAAEA